MTRRLGPVLLVACFFVVIMCGGGGSGSSSGCGTSPSSPTPMGSASLSGTITSAATSAPVAAATVTITPNGQAVTVLTTGTTGQYSLGGLLTGAARIDVKAAGFRDFTAPVTLAAGANTQNVVLTPAP